MAPGTRNAAGRRSQPRRKASVSQQSRQSSGSEEPVFASDRGLLADEDAMDVDEPSIARADDVERAVFPLRKVAEKVGKEVEIFAEELDKFRPRFESTDEKEKRKAALDLVSLYSFTADETTEKLRQAHGEDLRDLVLNRNSGRPGDDTWLPEQLDDPNELSYEDLLRWQDEYRTWKLVHDLLLCDHSEINLEQVAEYNDKFHADGRHWTEFLRDSKTAQERHTVLRWLESTAETTGDDLDLIEQALDVRYKRGLTDGWGDTRDNIKGQKRLRLWDVPVEIAHENVPTTKSSDGSSSLVTQLDPDAVTRQGLTLEKNDMQFEDNFWRIIWEMLRRGHPMYEIRQWCIERGQQAMALSIGAHEEGCSQFPSRRFLWRQACFRLARLGGLSSYERAAFGLLSGDERTVEPVCKNWSDSLYIHYNAKLIREYESWLSARHGQDFPSERRGLFSLPTQAAGGKDYVAETRQLLATLQANKDPTIEDEDGALQPVQAALIGHYVADYIFLQGVAMSRSVQDAEKDVMSHLVSCEAATIFRDAAIVPVVSHPDALRVLAHLCLIFKEVGHDFGEGDRMRACENVLKSYIQYLCRAGKYELTPGYAARLSRLSQINTVARICPQIEKETEREGFINLMKDAEIDVQEVISLQTEVAFAYTPFVYPAERDDGPCESIELMMPESDHKWPGQRIKKLDRKHLGVEAYEKALIESTRWFSLVEGDWARAFDALSEVALAFLKAGRIQAAIELFRAMPFAKLSIAQSMKFEGNLKAVDVMDSPEDGYEGAVPALLPSSRRRRSGEGGTIQGQTPEEAKIRLDLLKSQAQTYFELEQLVDALSAIIALGIAEEDAKRISDAAPRDDAFAESKRRHNPYIADLVSSMEPLLHDFLIHPSPFIPAKALEAIRIAYLPEMIIAYNSALHFAGYLQTREHLLQCLDLATDVAANDQLIACFKAAKAPSYQRRGFIGGEWDGGDARGKTRLVKANGVVTGVGKKAMDEPARGDDGHGNGRMKELVDGFALASKAVLDLNERNRGGPSKKKARKEGRTLGIWDISE